jgi:hypothetical protein
MEVAEQDDLEDGLYDENARTFRQGQIDGWRSEFSAEDIEAFDSQYGDILELYGYTR